MGYKSELISTIKKYNSDLDQEMIIDAYTFANECHEEQYRKSGDKYILHPVEVAKILIELKMDSDTIVAGILHDIVEDTIIPLSEIEYNFGPEVANIVDGVTKLGDLPKGTKKQHENIRKMIVAMAKDIRVIIIKLADRLHNMRTLKFMPKHKQERIAMETLEIYAPIAHRLGMAKIKWELEDLSFFYLEEESYREIVKLVDFKRAERESYTDEILGTIREAVEEAKIEADVSGRVKHFYSIYKKMSEKHKSFDDIYDLIAIRVIVQNERDCYNVLGFLHSLFKPVPGRFKDYIAVPKSNGYQSIHTTIVGPQGKFVEVQIRTEEMHNIAENGVAAHWSYKEKKSVGKGDQIYMWLKKIHEAQHETEDSEEFVKTVTGDIINESVFVFSPQGDVLELVKGSTPIDFAFHVHTQIGYRCIGAKVNNKIVTLDYKLQNGDQVEIITAKNAKGPSLDWLDIVASQSSKNKIRRWIKEKNFDANVKKGMEVLEKELSKVGVTIKEFENSDILLRHLDKHKINNKEDLYFRIAESRSKAEGIAYKFKPDTQEELNIEELTIKSQEKLKERKTSKKNDFGVIVSGLDNTVIRFAKCCSPLPGDDIRGYITKGAGIAIHRANCKNFKSLVNHDPAREIEVNWDSDAGEDKKNSYSVKFSILVKERPNILVDILGVIANHKINVLAVNSSVSSKNFGEYGNINLELDIRNKEEYQRLITHINEIQDVINIKRLGGNND